MYILCTKIQGIEQQQNFVSAGKRVLEAKKLDLFRVIGATNMHWRIYQVAPTAGRGWCDGSNNAHRHIVFPNEGQTAILLGYED